jgi:hypothetical protein
MGSVAEPAARKLIGDADELTATKACDVLKDVGTAESLPDLDALAAKGNGQVSRAARIAAEVIRARSK